MKTIPLYAVFYSFKSGDHFNRLCAAPKEVIASLKEYKRDAEDNTKIPTKKEIEALEEGYDIWVEFKDTTWATISRFNSEDIAKVIELVQKEKKK